MPNANALPTHYENGDMSFATWNAGMSFSPTIIGRISTIEQAFSAEEWEALNDDAGGSDIDSSR